MTHTHNSVAENAMIIPSGVGMPVSSSLCALAFADLLTVLDRHIACEADLEEVDLFDPAFRNWLDEADAAQDALYEVLARITGMTASCETDVPLRRMALILATLIREGRASAFCRYAENHSEFALHLRVPPNGTASLQARRLIAAADMRIATMARLHLYRQDGDDLAADTPSLAA